MMNQTHWTQWPDSKLHELANWFYTLITTPEDYSSQIEPFDDRIHSFFFSDSFHIKFRCPFHFDQDPSLPAKKGIILCVSLEDTIRLRALDPHIAKSIVDANVQAAIDQAAFIPPGGEYFPIYFDFNIMEESNVSQ